MLGDLLSTAMLLLILVLSTIVTEVFGNLHGAVDTLIVETDYGNVRE